MKSTTTSPILHHERQRCYFKLDCTVFQRILNKKHQHKLHRYFKPGYIRDISSISTLSPWYVYRCHCGDHIYQRLNDRPLSCRCTNKSWCQQWHHRISLCGIEYAFDVGSDINFSVNAVTSRPTIIKKQHQGTLTVQLVRPLCKLLKGKSCSN